VQWWASLGGLHGLAPRPAGRLLGQQIQGQHSEGWLNHSAELSRPLEPALAARWLALAKENRLSAKELPAVDGRASRGDWIRAAFKAESSGN